jgi:hypothetical protein
VIEKVDNYFCTLQCENHYGERNMSTMVKRDDGKVRATHRTWRRTVSNKPMFTSVLTLDPLLTADAWVKLSIDTPAIEFQELPVRLHNSLVEAVRRQLQRTRS